MLNFKRFLILKPIEENSLATATCVAKIVCENNQTKISCEILKGNSNLSICGEIDGEVYDFSNENSLKFNKVLDGVVSQGASVILYNKTEFLPIMFGYFGNVLFTPKQVVEKIKKVSVLDCYDDEVIATENYFQGEEREAKPIYINADNRYSEDKENQENAEEKRRTILYENASGECEEQRFYQKVKNRLNEIISSHPKDETLCAVIPDGEFVKVNYDSERFYSVGRIINNGETVYLCYAVPGSYDTTPPPLKPYCRFIPSSPFNPLGNGYFVIFQSAKTGEIVTTPQTPTL